MNTIKLQYITEILAEQINHWALFPVIMTVTGIASTFSDRIDDSPNVLMWGLCSLFPLAFFILREKAKHFFPFLLLHIAIGAASFLLPGRNMVERVLAVFLVVCYMIYSFASFFKESDNMTEPFSPIILVLVSAVAIFLQDHHGQSGWDAVYVEILVGVLALFAIDKYICNYLEFLAVNESSASTMPASDMFHSGIGLVSGYTLFGAGFLLLAGGGGWAASLREGLRSLLLWVVRSFFYLLALLISSGDQSEEIMETPQAAAPGGFEGGLPEAEEPFLLWKILEIAVVIALVGLLLFLLFKGTLKLIKFVRGHFAEIVGRKAKEISKGIGIDVREKCEIEKSRGRKGKKSALLFLSPYERVRRLYKKKVLSCASELIDDTGGIKTEMLSFLTARECADKLRLSALADIYEQTRYSSHETTGETIKQMKIVCRGK